MEDETDFIDSIVFDASKFLYLVEVLGAIVLTVGYVYLERFKNFEKFNVE
jgi:hypothetical protein